MLLRLLAPAGPVALAAALTGCGPDWVHAKGSVTSIDRKCEIIEARRDPTGETTSSGRAISSQDTRSYTGQCADVAEWEHVRSKHSKKVEGEAEVSVMYTRADGQTGSGKLHFDGADREFYDLRYGDPLDVLVDPADPTHLRAA